MNEAIAILNDLQQLLVRARNERIPKELRREINKELKEEFLKMRRKFWRLVKEVNDDLIDDDDLDRILLAWAAAQAILASALILEDI